MKIGKIFSIMKSLTAIFGVALLLLGGLSCGGGKDGSQGGNLNLQIVFPEETETSGQGASALSKKADWSRVDLLEISAVIIVDNDYSNPRYVGHGDVNNPGQNPYVDFEVNITAVTKVYFELHAYRVSGQLRSEMYRGYAVQVIDPGADNMVSVMMMPDRDHDGYFEADPFINYTDLFFSQEGSYRQGDCNDGNYDVNPGQVEDIELSMSCNDGEDNDCDGHRDGQDPGCSLQGLVMPGSFNFVYVEPTGPDGFMMGSSENELGRQENEDRHMVVLTQGFYMQTTEITEGQWRAVVAYAEEAGILDGGELDKNPSYASRGDNYPVESISWGEIQRFITALNTLLDETYRLPTEAEWEYAARAGTSTAFPTGEVTVYDPQYLSCLQEEHLDSLAWYCFTSMENDQYRKQPVGQKSPNAWGLYDMNGNIEEWCQDIYQLNLGFEPVTDPTGPQEGGSRVYRGGQRGNRSWDVRSAIRKGLASPSGFGSAIGFRLVRDN